MGKNPDRETSKANGKFVDPMSVTWVERYDRVISNIWEKIPLSVGKCLATIAVFVLGVSINGK